MDKFIWEVITNLVESNHKTHLIRHHLDSYECFLEEYIPQIVKEYENLSIKRNIGEVSRNFELHFSNVQFGTASYTDKNNHTNILHVDEAIEKNMTYCMPMYVDISVKMNEEPPKIFPKELVCHIPIMKGSKYCTSTSSQFFQSAKNYSLDHGGYFIIKGNEKVIVSQERIADNKPFYSICKDKQAYHMEIRSNKNIIQMANVLRIHYSNETLKVTFVNLKTPVPLFILFKYYGAKEDLDILRYIIGSDATAKPYIFESLRASFEEWRSVQKEIADSGGLAQFLGNRFSNSRIKMEYLAKHRILPHLKNEEEKLVFLGYMVRQLLNSIHNNEPSIDRDSLSNKKIETTGILLAQLFLKLWRDALCSLRNTIFKDKDWTPTKGRIIKKTIITNKINSSLATGNWDSKISCENKKCGIAQMLKRLTYIATISHLRRINSPVNKTGKLVDPRKLHNSQFGYCCVSESPEGQQIGLIKNLSISAIISSYSNPEPIVNILLQEFGLQPVNHKTFNANEDILILVNGRIICVTRDPHVIIAKLRYKRRHGYIHGCVSITYKPIEEQINIYTDEGRLLRPLFVVQKDGNIKRPRKKCTRFMDYLREGIIEWIDASESETIMCAPNYQTLLKKQESTTQYSHCEIHNCLIFGVSASLIPFPEHNQTPRILYECAQAKQAIGYNSFKTLKRMDTINHILHYPQRPLVSTRMSELIGLHDLPSGTNLMVAVSPCLGYNVEDSLIINRGAIDRGLFRITSYKTHKADLKKELSILSEEMFAKPNPKTCVAIKTGCYDKLNPETGIVKTGVYVKEGDIIIGKISPILTKKNNKRHIKYKDTSIQLKPREHGIVDSVSETENIYDEKITKVRIRATKVPEIGDKLSSRHGQKSTIGLIVDEEDMPFVMRTGMIPDIIINPHCLPSRMTIGQILECILGKYGAVIGDYIDGTAFQNEYTMDDLDELLMGVGYSGTGREQMFDPVNSQIIETPIYFGPTYYQRLKHLVSDKIHARGTGPISTLTMQPTEGRSRLGGLRLGSMEVDSIHSHGLAYFLQEKFFHCSDQFYVYVCDQCNHTGNVNVNKNTYNCSFCGNSCDFTKIALPWASKLLFYELFSMGVATKFIVGPK